MKSIEDLRSEIRAQALVLVGYSIAKDDAFLSDTAQILMEIAAPSDDDASELAEAYQNMRQYFSDADAEDGADSAETGDTDVLNGIDASMSVGLVDECADADSPVIGSFSEVSDEAVRAAGGDPVSRVDALNAAAQIVPDYGPIEG